MEEICKGALSQMRYREQGEGALFSRPVRLPFPVKAAQGDFPKKRAPPSHCREERRLVEFRRAETPVRQPQAATFSVSLL